MRLHRVLLLSARLVTLTLLLLSLPALSGCLGEGNKSWFPGSGGGGGGGVGGGGGGGGGGDPDAPDTSAAIINMNAGTESDALRSIHLRPNQTLRLHLATEGGNTAMWRLQPDSVTALKTSGLPPVRVSQRRIEQTPGTGGIVVQHVFDVVGLRSGRVTIDFIYDRLNSPNTPPVRRFRLDIIVGT